MRHRNWHDSCSAPLREDQQILRLDVAVNHVVPVAELNRLDELPADVPQALRVFTMAALSACLAEEARFPSRPPSRDYPEPVVRNYGILRYPKWLREFQKTFHRQPLKRSLCHGERSRKILRTESFDARALEGRSPEARARSCQQTQRPGRAFPSA